MSFTSGLRAAFFGGWLLAFGPPAVAVEIDLDQALTEVDTRLAATPNDLQLLFTRGMLLAERGQPMPAADAFRAMLAIDPGLLRPRLELARVLADAGDFDAARYHFEQVLAHELPDAVRRNVLNFLARIREDLPQFSATVEMVSDSNPKQATAKEEVTIGGLTYRLNTDARAEDATGMRLLLNGRLPLPNAPAWFVRGQVEHLEYPDKSLDFSYGQAALGRHFRLPGHTLTVEAGRHRAFYQHTPLYRGTTVAISDFNPLQQGLSLKATLNSQALDYDDYPFRDGWQHDLNATLIYAASPAQRWELNAGTISNRAREAAYRFSQPYAGVRLVREWRGGWVTGLGAHFSRTDYQADDPFFAATRHEREWRLDTDLAHRNLRIWRLAPRLQLGFTRHDGNLDFYTWKRAFVRLGMTAEF